MVTQAKAAKYLMKWIFITFAADVHINTAALPTWSRKQYFVLSVAKEAEQSEVQLQVDERTSAVVHTHICCDD